jgi:hypothetical protein
MQALAQRSVLVLVMTALLGSPTGLRAEDPIVSPESVGFSTDGLRTLQRTMRALVDDGKLAGVTTLVARHGKVVYSTPTAFRTATKPSEGTIFASPR